MRVFIYEFVSGGGWFHIRTPLHQVADLLKEGSAMLHALASDFAALPECEVVVFRDVRVAPLRLPRNVVVRQISSESQEAALFDRVARESDAVLFIAPEPGNCLKKRALCVEQAGEKLLAMPPAFIDIAADKWATHRALVQRGVARPETHLVKRGQPLPPGRGGQLVVKPVDGCGSAGMRKLRSASPAEFWTNGLGKRAIVEAYCPGVAASVALLCGPTAIYPLEACTQRLADNSFSYLGGACPLSAPLNERAQSLAKRAIEALPPARGYVGVDLVLGDAEDGSQDYVIEINPRLTTSYVGLRALSQTNLAQAMLDVALGREPQLAWKPGRVTWSADGVVDYVEA